MASDNVVPPHFTVSAKDARQLQEAMKGGKGKVDKIMSILGNKNPDERRAVRWFYSEKYEEDLLDVLRKNTTGYFRILVSLWMLHPGSRDAHYVNSAIEDKHQKLGNQILVEIACSRTPAELITLRSIYHKFYNKSIEKDVLSHRTGVTSKMLQLFFSSCRYSGNEVNWGLALSEATILHHKIKEKLYGDDEVIRILATRSQAQISKTLYVYSKFLGHNILEDLQDEDENENDDDDDPRAILRTAIECLVSPETYFEKILGESIRDNRKIDLSCITRVLATRENIDVGRFQDLYH